MLISSLSDTYNWSGPSWPKKPHSIILQLHSPDSRSPVKICSVHWMRQSSCGKTILQPSMIKECHSAQLDYCSLQSAIPCYRVNNNCNFFNVRYVLLLECLRKKGSVPTSCCHIFRNVGVCRLSTEGPAEKATVEWWSNNAIIWISTRGSGIFFQWVLDMYIYIYWQ